MGPWWAWGNPGTSSSALVLAGCLDSRGSVLARVTGLAAAALAKVLGPSSMGKRPAGADKRVREVVISRGGSCPSPLIATLGLSL